MLKNAFKLLVLMVAFASALSLSGIQHRSLAQPPPPPPPIFGIVEGYWRPDAMHDLGVSWERITFDWSRFQPDGPGDFNHEAVRGEWLRHDFDNHREVVGMIINTPVWASASGLPTAVPDGLYRPPDSPENYWAIFLRQLGEIYAPLGIHRWIIWNKPDIRSGDPGQSHTFDGNAEDYYRLVKVAHNALRSVDDKAEVFLGGLVWWNDIGMARDSFLTQFLSYATSDPTAAENNAYFDGVSLNILITPTPINGLNSTTDSAGDMISSVRQQLEQAGLSDKRIWVTELNASPTLDAVGGLPDAAVGITIEQQADFIVQSTALVLGAGAERVAVYKLFDSNFVVDQSVPFGLVRYDNSRRPAFDAYRYAIETFSPTLHATAGRSPNARLVVLEQPSRTVFIMWSASTQAINFWIEARFSDALTLTDALGHVLPPPRVGVGPGNVNVFVVETPPATVDSSGAVLISGSPRILILETTETRSVWGALSGDVTGVELH